jgi:hypothetical protein
MIIGSTLRGGMTRQRKSEGKFNPTAEKVSLTIE